MSLFDDAVHVLKTYEGQSDLRDLYLEHLAEHPDGMYKPCSAGHLTSSALVIDPVRERVLLTLHKKLGMWLQMGGHCEEGDPTLEAAALREAREESGIAHGLSLLPGGPVRLDRHPIPAPCHWHLDVQYAALAPAEAVAEISDESLDLRWFPYAEVPTVADASVVQLLEGTLARL
ncbi:NUDIX hydrolase [Streptomyces sp. WAC06614]|uniref:NUDIX hydrolase n=1 Tax=Streptomyces sp. WAC06614 TaxID=2487416 RepID=UPI000F77462A|nr:NUDIX hydrolase [Streptomyces sp. WAC06614]RSS82702.1 NUDIX domain-containing protein [Streptomyces sp. WAC06614]